ncbi:unnamed protein product [Schistocephalus solidus]|uniref:Reverse transcriptase domain-containing protein n=1 Tax=Schistocephalus solidus TaxID=70667 RepID=A0A183SDN0_SCHSO|nr:unnamed protein product [Schistocephalus solidus]
MTPRNNRDDFRHSSATQEKCQEMRTHLYTTFVDRTKAFDTTSTVMRALRSESPIKLHGHLLNSRRMQAPKRVSRTTVHDSLFANDYALNTATEQDMQRSMDLFAAGYANVGLKISTAKTIFMHPPPPSAEYNASRSNVNGAQLKMWKPLLIWEERSHATRDSTTRILDTKVLERIGILSIHAMLRQVHLRWSGHLVRMDDERLPKRKRAARKSQPPRINTANAQALSACPSWQRNFRARIGLVRHLRTQCNNNPTTQTSATPALDPTMTSTPTTDNHFIDAPSPTITDIILPPPTLAPITATNTTCPTPTTSVATSDNLLPAISTAPERLPKQLIYGDVATGSRRHGGQVRRYEDTLKTSLKQLQINPANWDDLARNRPAWSRTVKTGAVIYEANRMAAAKVKKAARKSPASRTNTANAQTLPTCPRCQRTFDK